MAETLTTGLPAQPDGGLWTLMNSPRPIEPWVMRLGCLVLAAVYGLMAVLRDEPAHPSIFWDRAAIALHGLLGAALAHRMSFAAIRVYTVTLAFLLSLGGGWVAAVQGNPPGQVPLTGLCTFVALAFLQTGVDVLGVSAALAIGHALLLLWLPPLQVPYASVIVMVGSSIATGAVTCLLTISYSARLRQSLSWWRDACERERDALRVKSEFLNMMSHELRSPLNVILGYAEILGEDVENDRRAPVERIRGSALELLQLVENTMKAARLEAGRWQLDEAVVDPGAVLRELASDVGALPEAKSSVPIVWRIAGDLPPARLDRLKLKEVVQNLVSNALKFTRDGSITVDASASDGALVIRVEDTGCGIPPAAQERIFEMFERVDAADGHRPPGVGLGLHITRTLVALMGGTIAVRSVPGDGTCFTVRLPLVTAGGAARPTLAQSTDAKPTFPQRASNR